MLTTGALVTLRVTLCGPRRHKRFMPSFMPSHGALRGPSGPRALEELALFRPVARALRTIGAMRTLENPTRLPWASTLVGLAALLVGCASTAEHAAERSFRAAERPYPAQSGDQGGDQAADETGRRAGDDDETALAEASSGTFEDYLAFALTHNPRLRAEYERWRAEVLSISRARRLPDPMLTYAFFVRRVQTRVGPQRHRLSVRQDLPWPTQVSAGVDAAVSRAQAQGARFDARVLQVRAAVAERYWRLWGVRESQRVRARQLEVIEQLAETARARIVTGESTLAEFQQVDLMRARMADSLEGLGEEARSASAALVAIVGAPYGTDTPTSAARPDIALPGMAAEGLRELVASHPDIGAVQALIASQEAEARRATAEGLPRLSVGLDWIETGPAPMAVAGSGDDAVVVSVGATIPLQRGRYRDARDAALARAAALRGDRRALEDQAVAGLEAELATLRDTRRRVRLHRHTLIPQALTAYEAVLGAYQVGRGSVAANLLAQRDLIELEESLVSMEVAHALAWARVEALVGRAVERDPSSSDEAGSQ